MKLLITTLYAPGVIARRTTAEVAIRILQKAQHASLSARFAKALADRYQRQGGQVLQEGYERARYFVLRESRAQLGRVLRYMLTGSELRAERYTCEKVVIQLLQKRPIDTYEHRGA